MTPDVAAISSILTAMPSVELAYVFGSLARGCARPDSDADVAVLASAPLDPNTRIALVEELATATGRAIDLIDLSTAGEPLLGQVLHHGIRVKGSDTLHAQLVTKHIFDTEDFLPYVQRMLEERRKSWIV